MKEKKVSKPKLKIQIDGTSINVRIRNASVKDLINMSQALSYEIDKLIEQEILNDLSED